MRRLLDYPVFYLGLAILGIGLLGALGFHFGFGSFGPGLGLAAFGLAAWLIAKAVAQFHSLGTPIQPHRDPKALITGGIFTLSRHPIYLGYVLIALGATFWADAPLGLGLVFWLVYVLKSRFIAEEERILANMFPKTAAKWMGKTPRWI